MKFVSLVENRIGKSRRAVSQSTDFHHSDDDTGPEETAKLLRQLVLRLNRLEAKSEPEAIEFDVLLNDTGSLVELPHNLKSTFIRWSVVGWFGVPLGVSPIAPPVLVYDSSSTANSLFLRSFVAGRAIIRIEPSQSFIDVSNNADGGSVMGSVRRRATFSDVLSHALVTLPMPDNCVTVYRFTVIGKNRTTLANVAYVQVAMITMERKGGGAVNAAGSTPLVVASPGLTAGVVASGNNIVLNVQNTVAAQTVDWTCIAQPMNTYLRDEP